ncbi:type II secretion system protein [Peptostreptococcus faecalis]|uniref:type II secretion system protein n=1 Tax=Peptostreptococcus faecalis TaxID=2045015 RepID=UPI000C7D8B12|nr:type II secretion system protein [Peptostreptococcus faecalis]
MSVKNVENRTNYRVVSIKKSFKNNEMVIVVAIIGILATVVAIKFGGAQKKARENADYANASNIATAVYMAQSEGKDLDEINEVSKLVGSKYLSSEPKPQSVKADKFTLVVSEEEVTIKAGEEQFYPKVK